MVFALLAAIPTASMGFLWCLFGNGVWSGKTKAEHEAARMTRVKSATLYTFLLALAMRLWMKIVYGSEDWLFTLVAPTIILSISALMQLQHLKSTKTVLKNKDVITQKLTPALTMLVLQLVADMALSARKEAEYACNCWISTSMLIASVLCHYCMHRILENIIQSASSSGGAICSPCRNNPPLSHKYREGGVIVSGIVGYVYIQYCYVTSDGDTPGVKHMTLLAIAAVIFETSAAKMVHVCLKHAELVRAQGKQMDNLLALMIFASSHLTLFRGYFCLPPEVIAQSTLVSTILIDAIRYGPQLILWIRAFNLDPPKISTSWFSPCVVCNGRKNE